MAEALGAVRPNEESTAEKLTLTNKTLRNQITHAEATLRQKEEMGEVLHAVDFEKLKIENQQYAERIEELERRARQAKDSSPRRRRR